MKKNLLLACLAMTLFGCTSTRFVTESPAQIPINPIVKLDTASIWPLRIKGTYLQKATVAAWGKEQTFSVYLTLEEEMIEAIAFNDLAGRLYRLKCTPENVIWEKSALLPSMIKPDNILTDFLLINLDLKQLNRILKGARVFEKDNEAGKTRIIRDEKILRTIHYSQPMGDMWGLVVIENPINGYQINIQTVVQ
jgi:hypothetical protein